ncbi:MAG: hypothetical protein K9J13_13375 [Saprospiraceae bacterium]|nr:hypothetical protein [Saprospiraceae bacterium]
MKKLLLIFCIMLFALSGMSQKSSDEIKLIIPHPYFMKPNGAYIDENYAIVYRKTDKVVYCVFDVNTHKLLKSGALEKNQVIEEISLDLELELSEHEEYIHEIYKYYELDTTLINNNPIKDRKNIITYHDETNKAIISNLDEQSISIEITISKILDAIRDDFNYSSFLKLSISPDRKQIAIYEKNHIYVYSTLTQELIWTSEKLPEAQSEGFLLMNNSIIVLPRLNKKNKYDHVYWYNFSKNEIVYSSKKSLMNSFIEVYQAYNYLIMTYGNPENKKVTSSSYINLKTGKFGEFQESKWSTRYSLSHYVQDSIVKNEISEKEYGDYFENYTIYDSWYDYLGIYYEYDDEFDKIRVRLLTPVTVHPTFFTDNGYNNDEYSLNYEIISAYKHKVTYKDASKDIKMYNIKFLKKEILFWNGNKKNPEERKVSLIVSEDKVPIFITPDNYYYSTKGARNILAFSKNNKRYSFEQFDLKYNRPDIVLSRLGYADTTLITAYYKAYLKRLNKMGFKEEDLGSDFHMPESKIKNFEYLPIITNEKEIELDLNFNDTKYNLDRINVWINNVPVYGVKGISVKNSDLTAINKKLVLNLSKGNNKIQVSCHNVKGVESYKETVEIQYEPKEKLKKPELYIIAISVSNYLDNRMNLQYAVKDGRDITNTYLSQKELYSKIHVDTLFDKDATKTNILKLKQKLLQSKIDDQVIVFVSGHGLLDENFDFYFATYDIDFDYPQYMGITYNSLESLLDSIPARKKLLLMDACHSGEVDKDDIIEVKNSDVVLADGTKSGLKTYTYRSSSNEKNKASLNNSFELMQELFTNLNRGSGAVVISAAAGSGYALESPEWNNGVFTYSVINGIKNKAADENKNKEITVGELQKYVAKEVQTITEGEQKPTARQENLEFDFRVW